MSTETKSWLILHGIFFVIGFIAMLSVKGLNVGVYIISLFSTTHFLMNIAVGIAVAILSIILFQPLIRLVGEAPPQEIQRWMTEVGRNEGYSIMALTSIGEEWIFRGAAQGLLTLWLGIIPAILITSIVFMLLHIQSMKGAPIQLILAGILSVILGILFYTTRSLYAPIAFHAVYNVLEVWVNRRKMFGYSVS